MLLRTMSLLTERSFVHTSKKIVRTKKGNVAKHPLSFFAISFHVSRHANIV